MIILTRRALHLRSEINCGGGGGEGGEGGKAVRGSGLLVYLKHLVVRLLHRISRLFNRSSGIIYDD